MRTLIFATLLLFSFTLVGCKNKDNRPPLVRANELLRKNHLPEMDEIDSIFGYEDVYDHKLSVNRFSYFRDSLRMISRKRELTEEEKEQMKESNSDSEIFLSTSQELLREHLRKGDKEEFIGYECVMTDTASATSPGGMTIYSIDKDFKKVQVTKTLFLSEDYE